MGCAESKSNQIESNGLYIFGVIQTSHIEFSLDFLVTHNYFLYLSAKNAHRLSGRLESKRLLPKAAHGGDKYNPCYCEMHRIARHVGGPL